MVRSTNGEQLLVPADTCDPALPDWRSYTDLLVLGALEKLRQHSYPRRGGFMKDCSGCGAVPGSATRPYTATGLYEAYKLALYYFPARALRENNHVTNWIRANICRLTRRDGVTTHYDREAS